jgi:hypothetical protein
MSDDLRDDIIEGSADLLEVAIDQIIDSEVLKDIPVLGTAVRLAHIAKTIRDRLFAAKVRRFLLALPSIEDSEREKFRTKLKEKPEFREKLGETLLLTLENMNALDKADILARLFDRLSRGQMSFAQFHRLSVAINLAYIGDLLQLIGKPSDVYGYNKDYLLCLVGTGLVEYIPNANKKSNMVFQAPEKIDVTLNINLTDLGKLLGQAMGDPL